MTQTKTNSNIRAVKSLDTDAVLIYRAVSRGIDGYDISVERYINNTLHDTSSQSIHITDPAVIDKLLLDMCVGSLEPCHLKDVINDLSEA